MERWGRQNTVCGVLPSVPRGPHPTLKGRTTTRDTTIAENTAVARRFNCRLGQLAVAAILCKEETAGCDVESRLGHSFKPETHTNQLNST